MKILVLSLAGIGDTLMATPLVEELAANFPKARIDALVMWAGSRELLEGNPHLHSVWHKNLIKAKKAEAFSFLRTLRHEGYDISLNTYPQSRRAYRLVARFIDATERLSHIYDKWTVVDRFLVNRSVEGSYHLHAVENNLHLLNLLGVSPKRPRHQYELFLSQEDEKWATRQPGGDEQRILGIHVGSGTTKNLPLRRWPLDSWMELAGRVATAHPDIRIFLFGGPEEKEDNAAIVARLGGSVLVPATKTFKQTAALLRRCHAFISVDTSLMHLAAAMKVPHQFVIETPTFNKTVEPYGRPFVLIPNPMVAGRNLDYYRYDGAGIKGDAEHLKACMRSVTVEAVFSALGPVLTR